MVVRTIIMEIIIFHIPVDLEHIQYSGIEILRETTAANANYIYDHEP